MIRQSFYQLSRVIQDRFIDAAQGRTIPEPILLALAPPGRAVRYWSIASAVALVATAAALAVGYGNLSSGWALAPQSAVLVYGALASLCLWCAARAFIAQHVAKSVPYLRGRFVFPACLVDTTRSDFVIYPVTDLTRAEVVGGRRVALQFSGQQSGSARFEFEADSADAAATACEALVSWKRELLERELQGVERVQLDPLSEPRYSNPLSSRVGRQRPTVPFRHLVVPVCLVAGFGLGFGLGNVRNVLSERRLFARAVHDNSPAAYRAYLERGGTRPEVASLLLPRAELAALVQGTDLAALEAYSVANPDSAIRVEIDAVLRERLLAELNVATRERTLAALEKFQREHAAALPLVAKEVRSVRLSILNEVFERFVPRAAETPGLLPFMKAVMAHVAEHGPVLQVRFQRIIPESSARADELVRNDKYFNAALVPSQYFEEARLEPWMQLVFQRVFRGFGLIFPTDVLDVQRGPALPIAPDLPTNAATPTLAISYSTNMGRGIPNRNPTGTFFGVGFLFQARLLLDSAKPVELRYSTWKPPDLLKLREGKLKIADVYQNMANDAFKSFDTRIGAWLFKR